MANYIDKKEFHAEMVKCKRSGVLSDRAIRYFQLMANEISKTYYYNHPEDKDDAKARAVQDCFRYWKGFKESNVVQVQFIDNFKERDKVVVEIINCRTFVFVATEKPKKTNEFQICDTINRSLKSLILAINNSHVEVMEGFLDTIKKKLTIMDKHNADDLTIKSKVQIVSQDPIIAAPAPKKSEALPEKAIAAAQNVIEFKNPPDAFCYYTSTVRNGILKVFNELYPDVHKAANRISLTSFNDHQQRFYNI